MLICAASRIIDGVGDLNEIDLAREEIRSRDLRTQEFKVASIKKRWREPLAPGYIQGAPGPLQSIIQTRQLLEKREVDALIISGVDNIKSDFAGKREERHNLSCAYGSETILTSFDRVAKAFCERMNISRDEFQALSQALFENYLRTWQTDNPEGKLPDSRWFKPITEFYRGVDCANPSVDFSGCLIVMTEKVADLCKIPQEKRVRILACNVEKACDDSVEYIPRVVEYDHIKESFRKACEEAGIDFRNQFLKGNALLEVYTCYPVVPIAFLLKTKLVRDLSEIPTFLKKYSITITGGLNLGKAPWNNSTLNHFIAMTEKLRNLKNPKIGGLHSNGALGYLQGFAILRRE